MSGRGVLRIVEGGYHALWCEGCDCSHIIDKRWTFNGDYEKPTFKPSLLVNKVGKHHTDHVPVCHTFITDGKIQFLNDCTHDLAGTTIDLKPFGGLFDAPEA